MTRMTWENKVRFCVLIDRLSTPGETLTDASRRLALALDRCGFRGQIVTVARGDMDPITGEDVVFSFGPDHDDHWDARK